MYTLKLLGGVSLTGDAGAVTGPTVQRRRLAVLALLAAAPTHRASRDKIIAMLWPDSDSAKARHLVADALYELRALLGKDALTTSGDEVGLDPDRLTVDIAEFRRALVLGDYKRAAGLYGGPFLDGFYVSEAPEFERWAEDMRTQLAHEHARALERAAEESAAAGDLREAVEWWKRLAATDPFSSRIALRLMRAMVAAGDPAAAIRHARVHETLLREELDAAPDAEVMAFARTLQSPAPISPPGRDVVSRPDIARVPVSAVLPASAPAPAHHAPVLRERRTGRLRFAPALIAGIIVLFGIRAVIKAQAASPVDAPPIRSIAVLQFVNQSGDSTQDVLGEALTDALTIELSRYRQLAITPRTSVGRYRTSTLSVPEIARELGVDGVVEGSIIREGRKIRVNAALTHGASDRQVWADRFDRDVGEFLALEREIAAEIARLIRVAAAPTRGLALMERGTSDTLALQHYLRGRQLWSNRTESGMRQGIEWYEAAIDRDPGFALAYAGLAEAYRYLGGLNYGPIAPLMDSAWAMADLAVQLDEELSEAHASRGALLTDAAEWEAAEVEFKRAIELDSTNALAHQWYALMLATLDRKDDAVRMIRRARLLDPFSAPLNGNLNQIETYAGVPASQRMPQARGKEVDPTFPNARFNAAARLAQAGQCTEAEAEMKEAQKLAPNSFLVRIAHAGVYYTCGDTARARRQLAELERRPDARLNTVYLAMGHMVLGQPDSALAWLNREQSWGMAKRFELRTSPRFRPIRADPRYAELLKRVGLH